MLRSAVAIWALAIVLSGDDQSVQPGRGRAVTLAAGKMLVAARTLTDPNFAQTVVLLTEHSADGAAGLIVNVRTTATLSRAFATLNLPDRPADVAYFGGPVAPGSVHALIRSPSGVERARLIAPELHVVTSRALLDERLVSGMEPSELRVYLGYAGWTAGQLEREIALQAWHVFNGEAGVVFDGNPTTVWRRMIRRTEQLQARSMDGSVRERHKEVAP